MRKFVARSRETTTRRPAQKFCNFCDFCTVLQSATYTACLYFNSQVSEHGVLTTMRGTAALAASPETGDNRLAAVPGCRRCVPPASVPAPRPGRAGRGVWRAPGGSRLAVPGPPGRGVGSSAPGRAGASASVEGLRRCPRWAAVLGGWL